MTNLGTLDARPIRPTSLDTQWDHAVKRRRQTAVTIRSVLEKEGVEALVLESTNGNYPPWVQLAAWLPAKSASAPDTTVHERVMLLFVLDIKPFNEHQQVTSVRLNRGKRSIGPKNCPVFTTRDVEEWTMYALDRGPKPSNYEPFAVALNRNRIAKQFRTPMGMSGTAFLNLVSLIFIGIGGITLADSPILAYIWIILGIIGVVVAEVLRRRRKLAVAVTSQPTVPPRNIGLVDSWHAVVAEIGRDYNDVRFRIDKSIAESVGAGVQCQNETYGYRTPNGYEERERLVVAKGQGLVHVQMYRFGNDMFIGWQAFLNWAQWDETDAVSTKIGDGQRIEFRELRAGYYIPNELDLMELQSLSELVHRRIERELKTILKEKAIDQEIDFKIIRGDRDRALDRDRHKAQSDQKFGGTAELSATGA